MLTVECIFAAQPNPLEEWADDKQEVLKKLDKNVLLDFIEGQSNSILYNCCQDELNVNKNSDTGNWRLEEIRIHCKVNIDSYDSMEKICKQAYDSNNRSLLLSLIKGLYEFKYKFQEYEYNLRTEEEYIHTQCKKNTPTCHLYKKALHTLSGDETLNENQKKYIHYLQKLTK